MPNSGPDQGGVRRVRPHPLFSETPIKRSKILPKSRIKRSKFLPRLRDKRSIFPRNSLNFLAKFGPFSMYLFCYFGPLTKSKIWDTDRSKMLPKSRIKKSKCLPKLRDKMSIFPVIHQISMDLFCYFGPLTKSKIWDTNRSKILSFIFNTLFLLYIHFSLWAFHKSYIWRSKNWSIIQTFENWTFLAFQSIHIRKKGPILECWTFYWNNVEISINIWKCPKIYQTS